eukprot:scaffold4100_cov63-Cylindrotheca_fusiformis.AAC.1
MVSTRNINMFPAKGGISSHYSPHMILSHRNIDFKKHCQIEFGSYVQASQENDPTNTNRARTIDGIYLCPVNNIQGGHEIMDLSTGRVIVRPKVIEVPVTLPVTQTVINRVEKMAEDQGYKSLKFSDRNKRTTMEIFPDADQIAGVYGDENDEDDDYFDEENDENSDEEDEPELEEIDREELDELIDDMTTEERETARRIEEAENEEKQDLETDHDQNQEQEELEEEIEEAVEMEEINDSDNEIVNENDSDEDSDGETDDDEEEDDEVEKEARGLRRSTRERSEVVRLDPQPQAKSYMQAANLKTPVKNGVDYRKKTIRFGDDKKVQELKTEMCHNLKSQAINKENEIVYTTSKAS